MKRITRASCWIFGLALMLVMMLGMSTTSWADSIELEKGSSYEFGDSMVIPSDQKTYIVWDDDPDLYSENIIEPGSYLINDYKFDHGCDQWIVYLGDKENDDFLYLGADQNMNGEEYVLGIKCVDGDGTQEDPYQFELVIDESAHDPVSYLAWDDEHKEMVYKTGEDACRDYITVDDHIKKIGKTGETLWYVVDDNVWSDNHISIRGNVHLILMDDASLRADDGISVGETASLTIYAQSTGDTVGELIAETNDTNAIASSSELTINGGRITAEASGSKDDGISASRDLTINGGDVTASSKNSNGIGVDGKLTVNGGSVTASSEADGNGYGILCGGNIAFNGGIVTAFSKRGRGIRTAGGKILIAGGRTVLAGEDEKSAADVSEAYKDNYADKLIEEWVRISKEIKCTVTFRVAHGAWNDGSTGVKTVQLSGSEGNEPSLNADQIPAVGNKPDDNYQEGSWKRAPNTEMAITEDTVFIYNYAAKAPHKHDGVTFEPWTDNDSLPTEPGNYYLNNDVLLKGRWNAPSGTVNICLNGYDIVSAGKTGTLDIGDDESKTEETVAVFDCSSGQSGKITGNTADYTFEDFPDAVLVHGKGEFILNSGRISGNKNYRWTFYEGIVTVYNHGKFTMNGGSIESNYSERSCIVGIEGKSTFVMNGGSISNNETERNGAIVYEIDDAEVFINGGSIEKNTGHPNNKVVMTGPVSHFNMSGGSIIDNAGTGIYGYGESATLVLAPEEGKDIRITGNTKNLSLGGRNSHKITFAEGSSKLSDGSEIGITTENTPGYAEKIVFSEGFANRGSADKFVSDNENYIITVTDDGELALSNTPKNVTVADGIENGTIAVSKDKAVGGDVVTITVKPDKGYKLKAGSLRASADSGDVTINDEDGYKFTMPGEDVTISAEFDPIKVRSLTIWNTLKSINDGEKKQIRVSADPSDALNRNLEWTSSNTDVLTVDNNGFVTGVKGGKADVTVRTTDGSDIGKTMTIRVEHAQWSDWVLTTEPTVKSDGEETRECIICHEIETRVVPRLEHTHDLSIVKGRKATCVKSGTKDYYACSVCDAIYEDEKGEKLTSFGELAIPAKGHTAGIGEKGDETAATCVLPGGYNLITKCKDCGTVLYVDRIVTDIDPSAHDWSEWKVKTPATKDAEGKEYRKCKLCEKEETRTIPKLQPAPADTTDVGTVYSVGGSGYIVTAADAVSLKKAQNKKSFTVPATVTVNGKIFNVTGIEAGAFKGTKVKTLTVRTKGLTKASVKASLKGSKVNTVKVKVGRKKENKMFVKKYKKIFTKKNAGRKVRVI